MKSVLSDYFCQIKATGSEIGPKAKFGLVATSLFLLIAAGIWFLPTSVVGFFPVGDIYVSSPAVYTRERLVNDRNDQDFWLRSQFDLLDKATPTATLLQMERSGLSIGRDVSKGENAPESNHDSQQVEIKPVPSSLSFFDDLTLRSTWRDHIREAILENLLDDRHDLTGNSVYGLKFDTTAYPRWWTSGNAFVRISVTADEADWHSELSSEKDQFPDLPYLLKAFYRSTYSDINNNRMNVNYTPYKLFSRWLKNVEWRLNSHLFQISLERCAGADLVEVDWARDVLLSVNTILGTTQADLRSGEDGSTSGVFIPSPWSNFMLISLDRPVFSSCFARPVFVVREQTDVVNIFPKKNPPKGFRLVEPLDEISATYIYDPTVPIVGSVPSPRPKFIYVPETHYRNFRSIVLYLRNLSGKFNILSTCPEGVESGKDGCGEYVTIWSGYFNFVETVLKADMYAYSLFPKSEGIAAETSVSRRSTLNQGVDGIWSFLLFGSGSSNETGLRQTAVGFTDASSMAQQRDQTSVDFGWSLEVRRAGVPLQKSQFALISVPAWTSRLAVTVKTSWGKPPSVDDDGASYTFYVPIPPDYEAFDGFIAGEEIVRRPQINAELMDTQTVVACSKAVVLIPGLRLWRSAMVTLGPERANRITVLPNMGGIIAEFTKLGRPRIPGSAAIRVWTSEGVDSQLNKVHVLPPDNPADCNADKEAPPATIEKSGFAVSTPNDTSNFLLPP